MTALCGFHVGLPGDPCQRCGASWLAHVASTEPLSPEAFAIVDEIQAARAAKADRARTKRQAATPKQREWLLRRRVLPSIDARPDLTKREASDLLDAAFGRKRAVTA